MTKNTFFNKLSNSQQDITQQFLNLLNKLKIDYCVIGGLAANCYVEPVISLDFGVVVIADSIEKLSNAVEKDFSVRTFPHSINLNSSQSDLRIQLQTDIRYQIFLPNAVEKEVMGYQMKVAAIEDVLDGKIWAYSDEQRRKSKRQKDLADIFRIIESYPDLMHRLPESIQSQF